MLFHPSRCMRTVSTSGHDDQGVRFRKRQATARRRHLRLDLGEHRGVHGWAVASTLIGGLLTLAGLAFTFWTLRDASTAAARAAQVRADPSWQRRQLPLHAGMDYLQTPPERWDNILMKSYVDDRLSIVDRMSTMDLREEVTPLLATGKARTGATLLALGVLTQTLGSVLALYL